MYREPYCDGNGIDCFEGEWVNRSETLSYFQPTIEPDYYCISEGNDLRVTQVDYCTLTVRFLNSGSTVLHTPVTAGVTLNTSSSSAFDLSGSGGVRKIETQTTCTGSGGTPSNGVNFNNAIVKFSGSVSPTTYPTVSLAVYNSSKIALSNCGQNQQSVAAKIEHCSTTNFGATVDVGGGKIWKLVTKIGTSELWLDNTSGKVWSPYQGRLNYQSAYSRCQNLHTTSSYGITGKTWRLVSWNDVVEGRNNGISNFIDMSWEWRSYPDGNSDDRDKDWWTSTFWSAFYPEVWSLRYNWSYKGYQSEIHSTVCQFSTL